MYDASRSGVEPTLSVVGTGQQEPPVLAVPDDAAMTPLGDEQEFADLLAEMVADEAPRIFAVVQEYGTRADGVIAAWGMAFEDHAEVVGVDGGLRMSLRAPERALRGFRRPHITPRLVWVDGRR